MKDLGPQRIVREKVKAGETKSANTSPHLHPRVVPADFCLPVWSFPRSHYPPLGLRGYGRLYLSFRRHITYANNIFPFITLLKYKPPVKRYMIVDDSLRTRSPLLSSIVMNYHARGQTGKTIINYHENF